MDFSLLAQARPNPSAPKPIQPVTTPKVTPNPSIRNPQAFQSAKPKLDAPRVSSGSMGGQLNQLAQLAGQDTQPQRVANKPMGGLMESMKQKMTQMVAPNQMGVLAETLDRPTTSVQGLRGQAQGVQLLRHSAEPEVIDLGEEPEVIRSQPPKASPVIDLGEEVIRVKSSKASSASPEVIDLGEEPEVIRTQPAKGAARTPRIAGDAEVVRPTAQVSDAQVKTATDTYQKKLKDKLAKASPESPTGRYFRLAKLLNDYAVYKQTGKGPLADDPDALRVVESNLHFMKQELGRLAQHPEVKGQFQAARQEALKETFGKDYKQTARHYANHLLSQEFSDEMRSKSPEQRKEAVLAAVLKLQALDPDLVQPTLEKMAVQELEIQFQEKLQAKGPEGDKARAALEQTIDKTVGDYVKDNYPHLSKGSKVGEMLIEMLKDKVRKNPALMLSKAGFAEAMADVGSALKRSPGVPKELWGDIDSATKGLTKANIHGTVMSTAALFTGIYGLYKADKAEDVIGSLSSIAEGGSGLSKVARLLGIADASKLMKTARLAEALGPLGDALGIASDIMGAYRESKNEDPVGMYLKVASVGVGTASFLAGVAMLAGASGPAAPAVAVAGAIAGLGLAAADTLFAESDTTGEIRQTLREVGLSAKQDVVNAKLDESLGYFWDDHARMKAHFDQLKTPEEKVRFINGLLDRKDIWITGRRSEAVMKLLGGLSDTQVRELAQNGLNTQMLGRTIGFNPEVSAKLMARLEKAWPPGDAHMAQQAQNFLSGLIEGGHHDSFSAVMNHRSPGETTPLGDKVVKRLSVDQIQELVGDLAKAKEAVDPRSIKNTPHGKNAYQLLFHTSSKQFNALMEKPEGGRLLQQVRNMLVNTEDVRLVGKMGAWAYLENTSPVARRQLENMLEGALGWSLPKQYGPVAEAFVKDLDDAQLRALPASVRSRLEGAFQIDDGLYTTEASRERLKQP
jgi:hypothetical protein